MFVIPEFSKVGHNLSFKYVNFLLYNIVFFILCNCVSISNHGDYCLYSQRKEYDVAKEQIEKAVLLSPMDSMLWTQYARIEMALEHYPRARAMFNRACEVNSKDWYVFLIWLTLHLCFMCSC